MFATLLNSQKEYVSLFIYNFPEFVNLVLVNTSENKHLTKSTQITVLTHLFIPSICLFMLSLFADHYYRISFFCHPV